MKKLNLILLPLLLLAYPGCQKQEAQQTAKPVTVVDSTASADGVMIHYESYGNSDTAVVFVHGWACDGSYWIRQVDAFKHEYRMVTVDLAGHGKSGTNRELWTVEHFGEDVAAVVNQLDLKKVALVGHSMGGAICIEAARRLPDQVVVLVGVDTYQSLSEPAPEDMIEKFIAPFREDFYATALDFVKGIFGPEADSALVRQVADDMADIDPIIGVGCFEQMFVYDASAALAEMRKPIRSINCEVWPTNVEVNRAVAQSGEVVLMPGVGHFPHLEDPATFNISLRKILTEFLP